MPLSPNIQASYYMMLSMFGFTVNDVFIKSMDSALPVNQIMWLRGYILTVLIFILLWHRGLLPRLREGFSVMVVARSFCEGIGTMFFLMALAYLPFANISAILQALPLAVTLGAALLFHEPVGWRRWLAIIIGFCGVLIIIRPGMDSFDKSSLLVLVVVLFSAARDLITRRLPADLPSLLVSAVAALIIGSMGMLLTLYKGNWQSVSFVHWASLTGAAVFLFMGYQFIVLAMRTGEVAYIVPFRYTSLLWSIVLGYAIFSEVPDGYTILGSMVVVSMGLFTLYRERIVAKRAKIAEAGRVS